MLLKEFIHYPFFDVFDARLDYRRMNILLISLVLLLHAIEFLHVPRLILYSRTHRLLSILLIVVLLTLQMEIKWM